MSRYRGETYSIPLEAGGFCHNKNIDTIASEDMVHPSRNIWLNEGGIRKRGGTTPVDTNVMFTIPDPTFNGSGLDDLASGSVFTHSKAVTFVVKLHATGTPDTFKWMRTGGSWSTATEITGTEQTLEYGFKVTFAATTGHTATDQWSITIATPDVMGFFDHILANGNSAIVRATSDGKLWKDTVTTIATGLGAGKYPFFEQWGDYLIITNGNHIPMTWNGVAASASDFTTGVKAQGTITMAGVAVCGVKAQGTITMAGVAVAYETFVIGDQTFTWKVARAKKGDVKIGATAAEAVVNLAVAIEADLDTVAAADMTTSTVVVTAVAFGLTANSMVFTEDSTNMTMDGSGTLGGTTAGVDEETFVIDDQTFIWKTKREEGVTGEVTIGANAAAAVINLVAAINEDMDIVVSEDGAGDTVVITAVDFGAANNSMIFTEDATNMTMDGSGTLGGTTAGVDDQMPADWTGTNYPKQIILHGRLNSMRGWAVGCSLNPKNIYVSTNDDPTNFAQATVLVFQIETGDGSGITAGIEYGDRLLLFSKTRPFVFNDNDTNTSNWGYNAGQWKGGVAHSKLLVRTPNDLIAMMENGEIYSVTTAQEYGDYKAASLSRPSFIHNWIKEYVNLGYIATFHAVYDSTIRAVKIFVVRTGSSDINTCLCYFIDRPPSKAWVILDNQDYESGYSAVSSAVVKQSAGIWKLYTGSYNGKIWRLGEANRNDNGNAFQSRYKTPDMGFGNVREHKRYDKTKLVAVRDGTCKATISWWVDGQLKGSQDIDFLVGGTPLGEFILGEDSLGGTNILEESVTLGCLGKRLQLEIKNTTANESFFFSQMLIDFIPLGKRI